MPYRTQKNAQGYRVYNLDKGTSFQFHSHDEKKLARFLRLREAYSHGFKPGLARASKSTRTRVASKGGRSRRR